MSDASKADLPTAESEMENRNAGDDAMQDDLTEERDVTPQRREDVAEDQSLDP